MSTLDEVVKIIRETNQAEAARKKAADDLAIANENKKFDELKEALKKLQMKINEHKLKLILH